MGVKQKIIIKLAAQYEKFFGSKCQAAFCVSKQMQKDLLQNWGVQASVLYDKAQTDIFKHLDLKAKHDLYQKLEFIEKNDQIKQKNETYFTYYDKISNQIKQKEKRPILLISSTSWTKDEDFSILLDAMVAYENKAKTDKNNYPDLKLVITGKGPEKQYYEQLIQQNQHQWEKISIQTMWLEANDYPKLLASCDLGICLHYSSSGYDLPMKVVDMFGAGIPVFAIEYQTIQELVQHNVNGQIFDGKEQLFTQMNELFYQWPAGQEKLEKYRNNVNKFRERTFEQEWIQQAKPLLDQI